MFFNKYVFMVLLLCSNLFQLNSMNNMNVKRKASHVFNQKGEPQPSKKTPIEKLQKINELVGDLKDLLKLQNTPSQITGDFHRIFQLSTIPIKKKRIVKKTNKLLEKLLKKIKTTINQKPVALGNPRNACYINSVMQTLLCLPQFKHMLSAICADHKTKIINSSLLLFFITYLIAQDENSDNQISLIDADQTKELYSVIFKHPSNYNDFSVTK